MVGPTLAAPFVRLADFQSLVIEADVPEARLSLLHVGGPAEIVLDAWPSVRHRGRLLEISPTVNRAKATVVARVAFIDPIEGVLPDMSGRVSFLAEELDAAAIQAPPKKFVPGSAVVERGGETVIFRLDEGKARMERRTVGPAFGAGFELLAGPKEGTRVIANPPPTIADGYPVRERIE